MTEADVLSLRIQATRVEAVRRDLKSIQGDLMRMRQSQASFAAISRSNARAVSQGYDQMAQAAKRSADAQKNALRSVQSSVLSLAGSYLSIQGVKNFGGSAIDAANEKFRQEATMRALAPGRSGAMMTTASNLANKFGSPVSGMREMMTGLAASPIDPSKISEFAEALAILGSTGTADDLKEFARQIRQSAGAGTVGGDELRIMAERLPILGKALEQAGLSMGKLKQMSQQGDPLGFEQFSKIILDYAKSPTMQGLSKELSSSNAAEYQRMLNRWQTEVLEPLGAEIGPQLIQFGQDVLPSVITGAIALGNVMVWTVDHWKPVVGTLTAAFIASKGANIYLAASAVNAARALNGLAISSGASGIGGLGGRLGGLAKKAWGYAGNAGTGASGVGMVGGRGIAGGLSAAGNALGLTGGAASAPLAASAGAIAGATISAAAVAVGAYFATKYGLDALARAAGHDGYSDALRKDFARANGARIDAAGNESYRGTGEAAFLASRARSSAKRGAGPSGDIYAKYAGLDSRNFDAAMSRRNSQRPANRASTQNRVARETRDAIRGAT